MRILLLALLLAAPASAQTVIETNGPTQPYSMIDMDQLPQGVTSLAALNAAGTRGGATLTGMQLTATSGGSGAYELQTCGFALAAELGSGGATPAIINGFGRARYDSFRIGFDFGGPVTEFGMMLGDWGGTTDLHFFLNGAAVASYTTSVHLQCTPQYYQMLGGSFDRVEVVAPSTVGNFVILELYVEQYFDEPRLRVDDLLAGGVATLTVQGASPNGAVLAAYSLRGAGPVATQFGDLLLSRPFVQLPGMQANAPGVAQQSLPVPAAAQGRAIWFHAFDANSLRFSNGLATVIG